MSTATATRRRSAKSAAASPEQAEKLPLGQIDVQITEPTPGPTVAKPVEAGKEADDLTGLVDQLGLVKMVAKMEKGLVTDTKVLMAHDGIQILNGTHYVAKLAKSNGTAAGKAKVLDVGKFLAKCKERGIEETKVNAALDIIQKNVTFLSEDDLEACKVEVDVPATPGGNVMLNVDPQPSAPLDLAGAIKEFAAKAVKGKAILPGTVKAGRGKTRVVKKK